MHKSKIKLDPYVIDAIASSSELSNRQKINFLKYIGYMTASEKRELVSII